MSLQNESLDTNIVLNTIKKIFTTFKYYDDLSIQKYEKPGKRNVNLTQQLTDNIDKQIELFSPLKKTIIEYTSLEERDYLMNDMLKDDKLIDKIIDDEDDEDYEQIKEMQIIGISMEFYLAKYLKCPSCNQNTLKKYAISSMPLIDLVCVNSIHKSDKMCRYWQVKTKSKYSRYFNSDYITVSNYKYSDYIYNIKSNDEENKDLCIGFICIELDNYNLINKRNSFIVKPRLDISIDEKYYNYNKELNIIFPNYSLCEKIHFTDFSYLPIFNINDNYIGKIVNNQIENEYVSQKLDFDDLFYKKYIKYKKKYLQLKLNYN